jgi:hypothetical protein
MPFKSCRSCSSFISDKSTGLLGFLRQRQTGSASWPWGLRSTVAAVIKSSQWRWFTDASNTRECPLPKHLGAAFGSPFRFHRLSLSLRPASRPIARDREARPIARPLSTTSFRT